MILSNNFRKEDRFNNWYKDNMNLPSDKTRGIMDRAKAFEQTKSIPMDNPLNMDDGMLDNDNTITCPICQAKQSEDQPQSGTHCITTRYECGAEVTMAIWEGGNDPDYFFDKRCGESMDKAEEKSILSKITITTDEKDIIFMDIARNISKMSKCVSKQVGSVIVKDGRIISIGYNGTPAGWKNCCDVFDKNDFDRKTHHKFSENYEIHSEMNALLYASKSGIAVEGATLYCTLEPCMNCLKNLSQSGIVRILFADFYDLSESYDEDTLEMLRQSNVTIQRVMKIDPIRKEYPLGCS